MLIMNRSATVKNSEMVNLNLYPVIFVLISIECTFGKLHCKKEIVGDSLTSLQPQQFIDEKTDIKDEPKPKDEFGLIVSNSGPAVLESVVFFQALIQNKKGQTGDLKRFKYIWTNNADNDAFETMDDFNASYSRSFSEIEAITYRMEVCVYDELHQGRLIKHVRVAQGKTDFNLTDYLNGDLHSRQDLPHLVKEDIYETKNNITFTVNLTDNFNIRRMYEYLWIFQHEEHQIRIPTNIPEVTYNSSLAGNHTVELSVTSYPIDIILFETLKGKFSQKFILKDKVSSAEIHLGNGQDTGVLPVGEKLIFNITYSGSNPTTVCWNIEQDIKNITNFGSENCSQPITGQNHSYSFSVQLEHTGEQYINFSIRNDVSELLQKKILYGYVPDVSESVSVAVPVVFSILGICVIIFGIAYVIRIKRKPSVEVADFDFHPSLHHGDTHPFISAIKYKLYVLFGRNSYSNDHQYPNSRKSTSKSYGSVTTSHELEYL